MPITEKQREQRRKAIGSSDAAAALGLSRWKTPADLWAEKVGLDPGSDSTNIAMEAGNAFEAGVIAMAQDRLGLSGKKNQARRHPEYKWWRANLDFLCDDGVPLDAKFGSDSDDWGPSGSDIIPQEHIVQGYHQAACVGADRFRIAAFLFEGFGRRRMEIYDVQVDDRLMARITEGLLEFWACVETKQQPAGSVISMDTAKRIVRQPGSWALVDGSLVSQLEAAKENMREAAKAKTDAEEELVTAMGEAEAAVYVDPATGGRKVLHWREESAGSRVSVPSLKKLYPEAYEALASPSTRRVWRPTSLEEAGIDDAGVVAMIQKGE